MERPGNHYVHTPAKGSFEVGEQTAGKPRSRRAYNVDQYIDVTILTRVAAGYRAEHAQISRAVLSGDGLDLRLLGAQHFQSAHDSILDRASRPVFRRDREMEAQAIEQRVETLQAGIATL